MGVYTVFNNVRTPFKAVNLSTAIRCIPVTLRVRTVKHPRKEGLILNCMSKISFLKQVELSNVNLIQKRFLTREFNHAYNCEYADSKMHLISY